MNNKSRKSEPGANQRDGLEVAEQGKKPKSKLSLVHAVLIPLFLSACTTTTGNKIALTQANLTKIHHIGVDVRKGEPFSVRLAQDRETPGGAILGSVFGVAGAVVGALAEEAGRASVDAKRTAKLLPTLGDYDAQSLMNDRLCRQLRTANVFKELASITAETQLVGKGSKVDYRWTQSMNLDGILGVTLTQWGLVSCGENKESKNKLQTGLGVNVKLLLIDKPKPVWERNDLYLDGDCHTLEEFQSNEGMLKRALDRAIDEIVGKITNEIRFAQP